MHNGAASPAPFSAKLDLILRALSMSRGRLASQLGVDKSVVGRWTSGAMTPSEHNLSRLTQFIAERRAGFTMVDWDRDLASLAELFGVELAPAPAAASEPANGFGLPLPGMDEPRLASQRKAPLYEGFWRAVRPSMMLPGRFFYDYGMIRRDPTGLMQLRVGSNSLLFEGWLIPGEQHLYGMLTDTVGRTPVFLIFSGAGLHKAAVLEGLALASALDGNRTPTAHPVILTRLGDLSGDPEKDEARLRELLDSDPIAPEEEVTEEIRGRLLRNIGPDALANGGELLLQVTAANSLSRGVTLSGRLGG